MIDLRFLLRFFFVNRAPDVAVPVGLINTIAYNECNSGGDGVNRSDCVTTLAT